MPAKGRFKTLDGFAVCHHCGVTYSEALPSCPECGKGPPETKKPVIRRRYLCNAGYLCQMGGPDGVCCISCRGYHACDESCPTAQIWMRSRGELKEPLEDEDGRLILFGLILCPHLVKESAAPWT